VWSSEPVLVGIERGADEAVLCLEELPEAGRLLRSVGELVIELFGELGDRLTHRLQVRREMAVEEVL
jgi:hypothetical protein